MPLDGSARGGEKSIADAADVFAQLNLDGDPNPEMFASEGVERLGGAAGGGGGGGLPEESSDSSPANRQGPKTNADDNPFSFTKFLQGRILETFIQSCELFLTQSHPR